MANFKLLFILCLHAFFLIPSSGARLFRFHPLSTGDQALKDQKLDINISQCFEIKKISVTTRLPVPTVEAKGAVEQFRSSRKRALMEEAREAMRASIERGGGNPFESERLSPGGPDPHHH
ncbi:hypothetical protein GQ457_03G024290 [Hibiscus cannabinus]